MTAGATRCTTSHAIVRLVGTSALVCSVPQMLPWRTVYRCSCSSSSRVKRGGEACGPGGGLSARRRRRRRAPLQVARRHQKDLLPPPFSLALSLSPSASPPPFPSLLFSSRTRKATIFSRPVKFLFFLRGLVGLGLGLAWVEREGKWGWIMGQHVGQKKRERNF